MTIFSRREKINQICDTLTLWGIFLVFFAIPLETERRWFYYIVLSLPVTAWFIRILLQSTTRQWKKSVIQYVAGLIVIFYLVLLFGRKPLPDVFRSFFPELGMLSFCVLLIVNREYAFRPSVSHWKLKKAFDFAILCYGVIVLISAFLSFFPEESFPQLRKGFVIYLLLYLCISDNVRSFDTFKKVILAAYLAVLAVSITVLVQGAAYPAGSYMVKNWLVRKEAVRLFDFSSLNPLFHVQFPFSHFQKMSLFLAIGLHLIMLQYFITIKRISRQWVALTAFLAFAALILTLSRGALLALSFSMILLALLTKWKYLIPLILVLLLLVIIMPAVMRQYYADLFRVSEYKNPSSRVGFYLERWAVVGELIKKYPVFGTGYGSRQFESVCRLISPLTRFEKRPHPYSWYLQIACESGMLGLWAFLLFSAFLLGLLFQRWRQQTPASYYRDINASLIALLAIPYFYGLVNFVHAGGLGLLVWIIYGLCASYMKLTVKFKDIDELRKEIESQEEVFEEI